MSDHLFQPEAFEQIPGQISMEQCDAFTVGDRVRVANDQSSFNGCAGVVVKVDSVGDFCYVIRFDPSTDWPVTYPCVPFPVSSLEVVR